GNRWHDRSGRCGRKFPASFRLVGKWQGIKLEGTAMSAAEALRVARAAGIQLEIDGEDLVLDAALAPPVAVLEALSCNKAGVIALLRASNVGWSAEDRRAFGDERAGIAEFDGGLSRAEAEAQAFVCCVDEWLNHHPVPSPPGRCLACGGGEQAHDALVRHGIEPT